MKKLKINKRKIIKESIIIGGVIIALYLVLAVFFVNRFYFGTIINGVDVSCKTVDDVDKMMVSTIKDYKLELQEKENKIEEIKGSDIGLKYDARETIMELKNNQNPFEWILKGFSRKDSNILNAISYEEQLLKNSLEKLECVNGDKIVVPKDASLKYTEGGYIIEDEVYGNKINKDKLLSVLIDAIVNGKTNINLEELNCYEVPLYTKDSEETKEAKDILEKYNKSRIIYDFGDNSEAIDSTVIHNWLQVDDNMEVTINEKKVINYLSNIGYKYNTVGITRNFNSSTGKVVQVTGGNYGWSMNISEEEQALIELIKEGKSITKEPKYRQKALVHGSNDIGKTFVEIDMTKQHVWYYKNGVLVVEGDIVTGNMSNNCGTPVGTYQLNYKEKNATLKGEDYEAPVSFWMPFNGGIGIHDASWRSEFGGQIYLSGGSHGCVNAPYELAEKIFNDITPGTPIVCYFE